MYAAILTVDVLVAAVVKPRVAHVDHYLIEFVEVARIACGELSDRDPSSAVVVVEQRAVDVVIEVEIGEIVIGSVIVSRGPQGGCAEMLTEAVTATPRSG